MKYKHCKEYICNIDLLSYDAIYDEIQYCNSRITEFGNRKINYSSFEEGYEFTAQQFREKSEELTSIYAILLDDNKFLEAYRSSLKDRLEELKEMYLSGGNTGAIREPNWEELYKQVMSLDDVSFLREVEYMMASRLFGEDHLITKEKKNKLEASKSIQAQRKIVANQKIYK